MRGWKSAPLPHYQSSIVPLSFCSAPLAQKEY